MAKLDDIIEELAAQGRDDDVEELEKLRGSSLRKKASEAEKLEKELAEARSKLEELELAPKREAAFRDYGVDLDNLSKAERRVIEGFKGELNEEAISKLVEEYELPLAEGGEAGSERTEGTPPAAKVAAAAKQGPTGRGAPVIKPGDTAEWSTEKLLRFRDQHPEAWESLKRGETVTGVAVS